MSLIYSRKDAAMVLFPKRMLLLLALGARVVATWWGRGEFRQKRFGGALDKAVLVNSAASPAHHGRVNVEVACEAAQWDVTTWIALAGDITA